jgi:hypothetical protein
MKNSDFITGIKQGAILLFLLRNLSVVAAFRYTVKVRCNIMPSKGRVAELVYAADLKSVAARLEGSSPSSPTTSQLTSTPLKFLAIEWPKISGVLCCCSSSPQRDKSLRGGPIFNPEVLYVEEGHRTTTSRILFEY